MKKLLGFVFILVLVVAVGYDYFSQFERVEEVVRTPNVVTYNPNYKDSINKVCEVALSSWGFTDTSVLDTCVYGLWGYVEKNGWPEAKDNGMSSQMIETSAVFDAANSVFYHLKPHLGNLNSYEEGEFMKDLIGAINKFKPQ